MKTLVVVDVQNDFVPGGALPVPEGDSILPLINRLQAHFDLVVATQDWHPADHGSFAANHPDRKPGDIIELNGLQQILWPTHCVQDTPGAEFLKAFDQRRIATVIRKGTDPDIDSYSGFFDNGHRKATGLENFLREKNVTELHLAGLATDYCVKFTALDAVRLGFRTVVIEDACRGVNLHPGDVTIAIEEMKAAGVCVVRSETVLRSA